MPTNGFARAPPQASLQAAATDPQRSDAGEKSSAIVAATGHRIIFGGGGGGEGLATTVEAGGGGGDAAGALQLESAPSTAIGTPATTICCAYTEMQALMTAGLVVPVKHVAGHTCSVG